MGGRKKATVWCHPFSFYFFVFAHVAGRTRVTPSAIFFCLPLAVVPGWKLCTSAPTAEDLSLSYNTPGREKKLYLQLWSRSPASRGSCGRTTATARGSLLAPLPPLLQPHALLGARVRGQLKRVLARYPRRDKSSPEEVVGSLEKPERDDDDWRGIRGKFVTAPDTTRSETPPSVSRATSTGPSASLRSSAWAGCEPGHEGGATAY